MPNLKRPLPPYKCHTQTAPTPIWEAPSVAPWTISPDQTDPNNLLHVVGTDPSSLYGLAPHAGNIAAVFHSDTNATGPGASLTQTLTTSTANTYDVSLWIANPLQQAAQVNNVFSLSWNGQLLTLSDTNLTETSPGAKTYVIASYTTWFQLLVPNLTVTGTSTDLVISARSNDWATLVDDVIVQETPEPSTVVLLCAGAALMGSRRRRQQRSH